MEAALSLPPAPVLAPAASSAATAPAARPFDALRLLIEEDAYGLVVRAFQLGAQRLQASGLVDTARLREELRASRRMAPMVGLAFRRNLARRLSPPALGAAAARPAADAPAWLAEGVRRACAGQLRALRSRLVDEGEERLADLLQVDTVASALWDAAVGQLKDGGSARGFLSVLLPGLRDLLALACRRYRQALEGGGPAAFLAAAAARPAPTAWPLRSPAGRPRSVDLFCNSQSEPSLWFAHNLAEHFAKERSLRVNLYLPRGNVFAEVFRLFATPEDLPPGLALREFHSFGGHPPGDIAIAMADCELPPAYIEQRRQGCSRRWAFRLKPLGVDGQQRPTSPGLFYEVPLPHGFAPLGHVKPHAHLLRMRQRVHGQPLLFSRYLQAAGGLRAPLRGETTVYVELSDPSDLLPWLQAWQRAASPVRVLVAASSSATGSAPSLETLRQAPPDVGEPPLTVSALHLMSIQQGDPILAACDLVLTDDESVAVRSLAAGVPLLAPLCTAANAPGGLGASHACALAWDAHGHDARMRLLDGVVLDWVARQDLLPAWDMLLASLPALEQLAEEVAAQVAAAPHLGDAALAMA